MSTPKKPYLPKSVLDMKFMRKTKERIERELQNKQDHEGLYSDLISNEMRHAATGNYITEASYIFCEDLIEGRVSYNGMNPEIEKLMEGEKKTEEVDSEMKKDVSDEILLSRINRSTYKPQYRKRPSSPSKDDSAKKKK